MNQLLPSPKVTAPVALTGFWQQLLGDASLRDCGDLEKLVTGCEIIAALDDLALLDS